MTARARVERDSAGNTDPYGNKGNPSWSVVNSAMPCFWWSRNRRIAVDEAHTIDVDDIGIFVPIGSDIREGDRINGINDRLGNPLFVGILRIDSVSRKYSHLEAVAKAVQR